MKKFYLLLMCLLIAGFHVNAQNYVVNATNDTIDVNTTWDYDTIFVDTSLTILGGAILTIMPGTSLIFSDHYKILVEGSLVSEGTETDSIYYTVADTTGINIVIDTIAFHADFNHIGWNGIKFNYEQGPRGENLASSFAYCKFSYAKCNSGGGGVFYVNQYNDLVITHSIFENNYSYREGGAIKLDHVESSIISHCKFTNNFANDDGGTINMHECNGHIDISNCIFNGNFSNSRGGAIELYYCSGNHNISNCVFNENYSDSHGGAIDFYDCSGSPVVYNCAFYRNYADNDGGAIKAGGYSQTQIINNVFINNYTTDHGGGIMSSGYSNNMIYGNLFKENYSEGHGGAIKVAYHSNPHIINNH